MVYSKVSSVGLLIFVYSTAATFLRHKMCRSGVQVGCASTLENGEVRVVLNDNDK